MLVSTRGRYGMRMMIDIARHQGQGRVALREIGERQGISVKYLEQLARALCAAGLLEGSRGQGGGYVLARSADDITARSDSACNGRLHCPRVVPDGR